MRIEVPVFPITPEEMLAELEEAERATNTNSRAMLWHCGIEDVRREMTAIVKIREVREVTGWENQEVAPEQLWTMAEKRGLQLAPSWLGPFLALAFKDQCIDRWTRVAMKPVEAELLLKTKSGDRQKMWSNFVWFPNHDPRHGPKGASGPHKWLAILHPDVGLGDPLGPRREHAYVVGWK